MSPVVVLPVTLVIFISFPSFLSVRVVCQTVPGISSSMGPFMKLPYLFHKKATIKLLSHNDEKGRVKIYYVPGPGLATGGEDLS